ncbi:sulfatase [Thalassotalea nanhaiensis]|uniref:Sulfatase n=1 Tax=Thalassotalea nanhaiensis TaxID=3065648 RepID=A0ABY9TKE7_9GAMM|nr:sulfatase [Colwelliaceae bacterium SQ345]
MNKITQIAALFITLIGFMAPSTAAEKTNSAKQPNIVFIAVDDMNDWVGYMGGHPQAMTPNMDKLANQGVAFMNAQTVSPGCSPSRNALLYGVEPYNSGLYPFYEHDIHKQLHEKYVTLPRFLKDNGYLTYGSGKIHHGPEYSNLEWTDYLDADRHPKVFAKNKGFHTNKKNSFRPVTNPLEQLFDHQVASYGIDAIKKHGSNATDKPYFAAIGLVKPHLPFDCPVEFYDALPETIEAPALLANDLNDIGREGNRMRRAGDDKKFKKGNKWQDVRRAYLSCISWVDYNVGRIMDAVNNSPEANNTVVILWSDHGYHLGEKQSFKKFTLWEEASRVPFIIHDKRQQAAVGRKVDQAVTLINVYRTIADMANLQVPEYVDGFSLVPQLKDQESPVAAPAISTWGRGNYSVRTQDWRLIKYFDGEMELYHHTKDQHEWHNLANKTEYQNKLKELEALLPKEEAPTIEEYISNWSLFGADAKRLKNTK